MVDEIAYLAIIVTKYKTVVKFNHPCGRKGNKSVILRVNSLGTPALNYIKISM